MVKVKNKKVLEYFDEIILDFENSHISNEEIEILMTNLKIVQKTKTVNKLNAGVIYLHAKHHLDNIETSKQTLEFWCKNMNTDINYYVRCAKDINREWLYIKNWIDLMFDVKEYGFGGGIYVSDKQK